MKKISKSIYGVLLAGLTLSAMTGCIEEAEPRGGTVTQEMLGRSATATASIVNGLGTKNIISRMEPRLLCVFVMS